MKCFMFLALLGAISSSAIAANTGYQIALESDKRSSGYSDFKVDATMRLIRDGSVVSEREFEMMTLEGENGQDKSLVIFISPRDQRGVALLTHSNIDSDDMQWIYIPSIKRVKRISTSNQTSPFVGSEFSFEDMRIQDAEEFEYEYVKDEVLEGTPSFVVERVALDNSSGYAKQVVWFDKKHYRIVRIHFFDKDENLVKKLDLSDYHLFEGQFWRPGLMKMTDVLSAASTELVLSTYRFSTGLAKEQFNKNRLKRARVE